MLSSLLTRFDESKIAGDKQTEAQLAFNEQVSSNHSHLCQQMDLTQADIDETRKALERSPSPRGSGSATVINPFPPAPPPPPLRPAPIP